MQTTRGKPTTRGNRARQAGRSSAKRNGRKASFRELKAFGMWRDRVELTDPVQFTNELRARMDFPAGVSRPAGVRNVWR